MPLEKRTGPRQRAGTVEHGRADGLTVIVAKRAGQDDRPHCGVVGVYCEALSWLRRESAWPTSVCCRHYWGDVEQVAS